MTTGGMATVRVLGQPGDLGWVVMAHGELYKAEYGCDTGFEALVARIVADYAESRQPLRDEAWIAELDGRRVGCVACIAKNEDTAQLRILLVDPIARGHGLGTRLVGECVAFARSAGYAKLALATTNLQSTAARIYTAAGFTLDEEKSVSAHGVGGFVRQDFSLDLTPSASERD